MGTAFGSLRNVVWVYKLSDFPWFLNICRTSEDTLSLSSRKSSTFLYGLNFKPLNHSVFRLDFHRSLGAGASTLCNVVILFLNHDYNTFVNNKMILRSDDGACMMRWNVHTNKSNIMHTVEEFYKAKYIINKAIFPLHSSRYMQDKQPV